MLLIWLYETFNALQEKRGDMAMDTHGHACVCFLKNNKNVGIKCSSHNAFLEKKTFIRYAQNRKIGRSNNFKVFRSNKANGPIQGHKNRLWSPMSEGEEPLLTC